MKHAFEVAKDFDSLIDLFNREMITGSTATRCDCPLVANLFSKEQSDAGSCDCPKTRERLLGTSPHKSCALAMGRCTVRTILFHEYLTEENESREI